jgi:hypothetical protein
LEGGGTHPSAHANEDASPTITQATGADIGKNATCTGYISKAKRKVHEHIQNKLKTKYPAHNFNESRLVKRARGK